MAATLGRWGGEIGTLYNVGKGTKKYFSVQIGRELGVGRELPRIKARIIDKPHTIPCPFFNIF